MPSITLSRADAQKLVDFCTKHKSNSFYVAKDTGAYIGYNKGDEGCHFYFKGCDPKKNPDTYWETGQAMFGGDDFGEFLQVASLTNLLQHPEVKKIKFTITARTMKFEGLTR